MRRIRWQPLFIALVVFAAAFSAISAGAAEVIEDFHSTIAVRSDSVLEVEEKILINVENVSIKHGIIRHFPVRYRDNDGRAFNVGFDVKSVTLDGESVPCSISYKGAYAHVRIGDANTIISRGPHTFVIKYETSRQVGFFEEYDELYWNVTGNEWDWPIEKASCTVSLPQGSGGAVVPFNSVEWYVGVYGAKGNVSDAVLVGSDRVETTRALAKGEGITVVYTWQKGIVTEPPSPHGDEHLQSIIAIAAFVLSCVWFVFSLARRRGNPAPTVIARFYPPEGASPAFVRYIKSMRSDGMSMSANIVGLAVKGVLRIEEHENSSFLAKTKTFTIVKLESDAELTRDEEAMLMRLFPSGMESLTISRRYARILSSASNALHRAVTSLGAGLINNNLGLCATGALIFIACLASTLPFTGDSIETTVVSGFAGGVVMLVGCMRPVLPEHTFGSRLRECFIAILPALIAGFVVTSVFGGVKSQIMIALPFVAAAAVTSLLHVFSTTRTERGAQLDSEVKGLYLYMSVAEKDRLEMLNAPEDTPEVFERLLPYAMALGVAKTWGNRFASVLERAKYSPRWYAGPSPYLFVAHGGIGAFSNAVGSGVARGATAGRAPSLSSGAGGRGSSGGGGGGGGGSGW